MRLVATCRRVGKIEERRRAGCDRLTANVVARPRTVPAAPDRPAPNWGRLRLDIRRTGPGKHRQAKASFSDAAGPQVQRAGALIIHVHPPLVVSARQELEIFRNCHLRPNSPPIMPPIRPPGPPPLR